MITRIFLFLIVLMPITLSVFSKLFYSLFFFLFFFTVLCWKSNRNTRAEPPWSQRAGDQTKGTRGVSPAHLPPGGRAVRWPPRHPRSHAREGCYNGEHFLKCFPAAVWALSMWITPKCPKGTIGLAAAAPAWWIMFGLTGLWDSSS